MKMKKIITAIILAILLMASTSLWAAGSCTQSTATPIYNSEGWTSMSKIVFACTGDIAGGTVGTIPDQPLSAANSDFIKGKYLYTVRAYKTTGGTQPDAADVSVKDSHGTDLLGGKGVNLIPATDIKNETFPYNAFNSTYWFPSLDDGSLTLSVANQVTASATFTVEYILSR
jgi:hypothetical protein